MSVRCKFGASELRLNMLDPCLPLEYPVNVYKDVFDPREAAEYEHLASLAERGEWEAVLRYVEDHHNLINTARLRRRPGPEEEEESQSKTFLWTVLHWAASSLTADSVVIIKLIHFGALKSLKTGLGETAHDIAARKGRAGNILALLKEPLTVMENKEAIENIEEAVHKIIEERVGDKIRENGMQLPQLQILWEMSNECGESLMFPILGMRGGYSLDLDHEDNSVMMVGWSRAEGEEEIRHSISHTGQVTRMDSNAM